MPEISTSSHGTSLIVRLQDNEAVAWNELVSLYGPLVFHWCAECRLQSCDSADVMQEVFSAASKAIHGFQARPGCNLRGWLWTITQNKIRDFCRKRNNHVSGIGGTEANIRMLQVPLEKDEEPTGEIESRRLLFRALEQIQVEFRTPTWTAFWRSVVEGHNTNWIAQDLGISPNSVRQAKSRVLRRLRDQLGEQ